MRTTLTLEDDLVTKLRQVAQERKISFKAAVNGALRAGLAGSQTTGKRYRMPTQDMGVRQGVDLDRALRLAGELEDAEILRKLELRK